MDEHSKILFPEVKTCSVGRHDGTGLESGERDENTDDLTYCLTMQEMSWTMTMMLRISDTFASVRVVAAICNQMLKMQESVSIRMPIPRVADAVFVIGTSSHKPIPY